MKFKHCLQEAVVKTKWDSTYTKFLDKLKSLSTAQKFKVRKQSAANSLLIYVSDDKGWEIDFHRPDTKWGNTWGLSGVFPSGSSEWEKEMNNKYKKYGDGVLGGLAVSYSQNPKIKKWRGTEGNFNKPFPDDLQKEDIKEWERIIDIIKKES